MSSSSFTSSSSSLSLLIEGLLFSSLSVLLTFFFELFLSLPDVKRLRSSDRGRDLHNAGIRATVFNSLVLGAITFYVTVKYCCVPSITATTAITATTTDTSSSSSASMELPIILAKQTLSILKFLLIENLCYYLVHRLMHTPPFYWMHRFHHNFNTIVLPSSANAVSVPEFIVAYMTPFGIAAKVGGCDKASAMVAVGLVAVFNLVIHTPCLERWMEEWKEAKKEGKEKEKYDGGKDGKGGKRGSWWLPPYWWMVLPGDHIMHHRVLNCHYGAPMIHFDRIFDRSNDMMKRMNDLVQRRVGADPDRGNNSANLESKHG